MSAILWSDGTNLPPPGSFVVGVLQDDEVVPTGWSVNGRLIVKPLSSPSYQEHHFDFLAREWIAFGPVEVVG